MDKCKCDVCGEEMDICKMYVGGLGNDEKTWVKGHKYCMLNYNSKLNSKKEE